MSENMLIKSIKIRVFFTDIHFFLCQCTPAVNSPEISNPTPTIQPQVEKKKIASPYSKTAASYLTQAKIQEGSQKQESLLFAAGRLISEGQWRQGAAILAQTADLTPVLRDEKIFYWHKLISSAIGPNWH